MKGFLKNQLLELLDTVKDGIDYAVSVKKNKEQAQNVLADCRSAFIHIKKALSEGLNKKQFDEYETCIDGILNTTEILSEKIQKGKQYGETAEILSANVDNFYEMLTNEPIKKEIVFLPYKASMFDSLESVWKAADADENCDAYVIPIPYYDKNPDSSLKEEHYEGDLFPDYVPITHYNDYNFEVRKPDMIFIHNGYDDANYITTVHPFFYSKNLKKFTDKLVYIPYFVLDEVNPKNKGNIESISHFCTCPAVLNADAVIVQSEDMREIYIDVLDEAVRGSGIKREFWEKKIFGLGSPKFDRAVNPDNVEIPKDWLKIIERPDGSRKKIFFYNTSISALLSNNEVMLDKIKNVLNTFKENKDDVALLWRPHPLIKATISAMRPSLWKGYESIVNAYIAEGWGIYDDTPDHNRAMALSDVYYGDWSSLVTLYKKTGKPIMIQDCNVI